MSIISTVVGGARKVATWIQPHVPTIAVVGGSIAVCGGAFLACRATLKVDQVLDEHNGMMQHIIDTAEKIPDDQYTAKDMRMDKIQVYSATAGKFFKLYAPAFSLAAAGFASIFYGFGMIKNWHAMAVSTVAALDEKFANYRNNVIEEYGEEVDKKFFEGVREPKQIEKTVTDDEGNETQKAVDVIDILGIEDDFTWVFDYRSPKWESDYLFNENRIVEVQNWYTKHLQANAMDHVFMNPVGKDFGKPETGVGHFYGWTNKPGCRVFFRAEPFIYEWSSDEDGQFPMMNILPVDYDEEGRFFFINEEDEILWRNTYAENDEAVGYILHFNVDTDENGVPRQIYNDVYGGKKVA